MGKTRGGREGGEAGANGARSWSESLSLSLSFRIPVVARFSAVVRRAIANARSSQASPNTLVAMPAPHRRKLPLQSNLRNLWGVGKKSCTVWRLIIDGWQVEFEMCEGVQSKAGGRGKRAHSLALHYLSCCMHVPSTTTTMPPQCHPELLLLGSDSQEKDLALCARIGEFASTVRVNIAMLMRQTCGQSPNYPKMAQCSGSRCHVKMQKI